MRTAEQEREDMLAAVRRDFERYGTIEPGERLALQHANAQALRVLRGIMAEASPARGAS